MATQWFHLGDILSITTERLVSRDHIDGVYNILNFLTGDNLYTHQLPLACDAVKENVLEQLPQLRAIVVAEDFEFDTHPDVKDSVDAWLQVKCDQYGAYHELTAVPELWGKHDMLEDLFKMRKGRNG